MTDVVPASPGGIADPREFGNVGLEDVSPGDITIPRLRLLHAEGVLLNNLTNERMTTLNCVLLGLVKQRIMWYEEVNDNDVPQCKSPDFIHGFPNVNESAKAENRFPWSRSNFSPDQAEVIDIPPDVDPAYPNGYSSNGFKVLSCSSCIFKDWEKGDWKQPPCSEQHTYPLVYESESGDWLPALFTTQRSGIKASRAYLNSFAQTNTPMFTVYTTLSLDMESRGSVKYSVPKFTRAGATDPNSWREYAGRYRSIRKFIQSAPRQRELEEDEPSENKNEPPASASTATTSTAVSPSPAESDLPF